MNARDHTLMRYGLFAALLSLVGCYGEMPAPVATPVEDAAASEPASTGDTSPGDGDEPTPADVASAVEDLDPPLESDAPPVMRRLTASQYRHTLSDWFGPDLVVPTSLERDGRSEGLYSVGASVNGLSSLGVERYVKGAVSVAVQLIEFVPIRSELIDCAALADDQACLTELVHLWGPRLWRRPLTDDEHADLVTLGQNASAVLGSVEEGIRYVMTAILASPHFIYTHGISSEGHESSGAYTGWQMATRLALFLWDSGPDDALLAAAEAGDLSDVVRLREVVQGMLADPRARRGLRAFADDWLELDGLLELSKDPSVFPYFSPDIGVQAREETLRLLEHLVFDADTDFRTLMTTRTTFVTRRLAGLYGVPAPDVETFAQIELPADGVRAGLLGHASVLSLHASPNRSSPTLRGVFVRERLLCQHMPSPPANVDTTIPDGSSDAPTMRERLAVHLETPSCAGCHELTDLIGLSMENFDGMGGFRATENGAVIDPSGSLDGDEFADAVGLGHAVSTHPDFVPCLVDTLWAFANGRMPEAAETPQLDALASRFGTADFRLSALLEDIAMSAAFRHVGAVEEVTP
ncbi:MAG: DUF1592 domain-containing protein [Myxococcota bacterium]